jgi:hypothetical protein
MLICAKTFPKKKFPKNSPSFFCGWKYRGFVTKYLCFILEVAIVQDEDGVVQGLLQH